MKTSVRGTTAAAVTLAAALGLSLAGPHRASAAPELSGPQSGLAVTILSPSAHSSYSGLRPVEISAFYQGNAGNQVVSLDLYVDGVKAKTETLQAPETRGVVSFLVDSSALSAGPHQFVVRATASDAEVSSAKGSFIYQQPTGDNVPTIQSGSSSSAPTLSFTSPILDGKVQGNVKIKLNASDASGRNPYVSLFIDRQFKTLKTTRRTILTGTRRPTPMGMHTIEAFGYNDAQNVGHAETLHIFVNNPGGRTERRTDLQDGPAKPMTKSAFRSAPQAFRAMPEAFNAHPKPMKSAARRNADALLASVPMGTHSGLAVTPLVTSDNLLNDNSRMTIAPNLSDPFVKSAPTTKVEINPSLAPANATITIHMPASQSLTQMADAHLRTDMAAKPMLAAPLLTAPAEEIRPAQASERLVPVGTMTVRTHSALLTHPRHSHIHVSNMAATVAMLRAVGQTSVVFNQSLVQLDRPLAAHEGMLFSPLRQIFEYEGGSLTWQSQTQTVQAKSHMGSFALTIGQQHAVVNHHSKTLDAAPYLNNGRTMVPLSFVSQAMDVKVNYDPTTGHLLITSKK